MGFNPGLKLGDELTNDAMRKIFKCGNMGGMRRSKETGTLVIISDDTKGLYKDKWIDGVLHYTGMGKIGDQVLEGNQNGTLFYSDTNGVEVHLFEVMTKAVYTYRGVVKLVDKPYMTTQPDDAGNIRTVWMFPVKPVVELVENLEKDLTEKEIVRMSNQQLARRSAISKVDKNPTIAETTVYYRDPYLKEIVKRIAGGKCQYCGAPAPFIDNEGQPYLEEHHVKRLADGGTDTINNVVAICPNCHRMVHVLNDPADMIKLECVAVENERKLKRLLTYENELPGTRITKGRD